MAETPVGFRSGACTLHGTLGQPDAAPCRAGVVLIHGWSGCRMGPHRILVETARRLNDLGVATLRFDLSGRGESEGDPAGVDLDRMIADAGCAVHELRARIPADAPVVLWGMCSGGNVALGVLSTARDVSTAVCWSTYPFQSQRRKAQDVKRTRRTLGLYVRKALRPETWAKLFHGAINWRLVRHGLFGHYRKADAETGRNPQESVRDADIVASLGRREGRVLFVFGGADPEAVDARRIFEASFAGAPLRADFEGIPDANHNFYSLAWKRDVIERSAQWLLDTLTRN